MKKTILIVVFLLTYVSGIGVAMAIPTLEKIDLRDDIQLVDPDVVEDEPVVEDNEFYHYGPPSAKEIELLKDPYAFEAYMNLLPDSVKIMLLKKMEQDAELTPANLEEIPIEIREQALEQRIKEIEEEKMEEQPVEQEVKPVEEVQEAGGLSRIENLFTEYWVEFLALIVSVVGLLLGITGFSIAASKKKKSISHLMNEIDDTFSSFKWKSKRCEAELYRLHDIVDGKLKDGKLDESSYQVLVNRIDKYLTEIKELDSQGPREG